MTEDLISLYEKALSKATAEDKNIINEVLHLTNRCIDLIYIFERDKPAVTDCRLRSLAANCLEQSQLYAIKILIKNTNIEGYND